MDDQETPNTPAEESPKDAVYTVHSTTVRINESGEITDVTELFAVLRRCLHVPPPPALRSEITLRIRHQRLGTERCEGDSD